jgi:uncharacterized membrane protein
MPYLILKWLHILSAMVALGANMTYGIWLASASRKPEVLPFTLRSIKLIDDRLANPAYASLIVTGLLMVFVARLPLTTPWLASALVLYVVLVLLGLLGYTPALKKQIEVVEREGFDSAEYRAIARRCARLGILLAVLAVTIVFLMVIKPALWF